MLERQFLNSGNVPNWGHVSCLVLFGKSILFDEKLPATVSKWFHVCDLSTVASTLAKVSSNQLRLSANEQMDLLSILEITDSDLHLGQQQALKSPTSFENSLMNLQRDLNEAGTIFAKVLAFIRINVELCKSVLSASLRLAE